MTEPISKPESPRVVLFDLGNTLLYAGPKFSQVRHTSIQALVDHVCADGLNISPERLYRDWAERLHDFYDIHSQTSLEVETSTEALLKDLLSGYGVDPSPRLVADALEAQYASVRSLWRLEEDAHAALQNLIDLRLRLGIISNADQFADLMATVEQYGLHPYFEHFVCPPMVGFRKPHPAIFEHTLHLFGIPAASAVMVGDTLNADVLGANQAGLRSVWIDRRVSPQSQLADRAAIAPSAVVHSLAELPDLLAGWM